MRADMLVVAALAVLAWPAAAQQTAQPSADAPRHESQRPRAEPAAASERREPSAVDDFLDWLKRHADAPQPEADDYWSGQGRGGEGGGGDSGGGGDH